jgi:hypothetical protein
VSLIVQHTEHNRIRISKSLKIKILVQCCRVVSVPDSDPSERKIFGPPGSGSQRYRTDPFSVPYPFIINKNSKKILDFYSSVTSLRLFIFEE